MGSSNNFTTSTCEINKIVDINEELLQEKNKVKDGTDNSDTSN